ncbi:uncharacterized protein PV06_02352 [Exophiala oligosperma]|uniref:DUF7708 domain-containing protein n=1 Tax=Exophiala oligosperma TaxID=215243 RepID=A0A0D2EFJ0_9EURO|nr:uncharacterized protein PV06_02352 [Exophiala oligosperma]KIW46704.1 hypothetical protein PV06_02352 [Exophiala oligosperma]
METFLATLGQVQQTYSQSRHHDKARRWLNTFADRVVYYGNIIDVLVQHHPEYASLAWGLFKLIFVGISNHATTVAKLSKSLSQTSLLLPSAQLTLFLYPTEALLTTVARIYALILRFLVESIKFYKASRLQHSIDSVFRPWKLRFQETYDEIAQHASHLKDLSSLAAKAELRDIHLDLVESRKAWEDVNAQIVHMRTNQAGMEALIATKVAEQTALFSTFYTEIRLDLSQQRQTINQLHLNQLLSMPFWQNLPYSGESLEYCQSMRRRRRNWSPVVLPREADLQTWAQGNQSSLLVVSGQNPVMEKDFVADMARLIRDQSFPVMWALRFANHWDLDLTTTDVLRVLVLQALQMNPSSLTGHGYPGAGAGPLHPVTLSHLREAASPEDWLRILERTLKDVLRVFIVLDGDLLSQVTSYDRQEVVMFTELLRNKIPGVSVKIVIPASNITQDHIETLELQGDCVRLSTDAHNNSRPRPRARKPNPIKRQRVSNHLTGYVTKRRHL